MKNLKTLTLALVFAVAATRAVASEPLRYFGQTETAYHSPTPYGNNEKQALTPPPAMTRKFILNVTAQARLWLFCMAG